MEKLIGKEVKSLFMNPEKTRLQFVCKDDEVITFDIESDCCSVGWIEHITGVDDIRRGKVNQVEDIALGEVIPTRQEVDKLYGVKIMTGDSWGEFYLEFRNSSNGYYGSSIQYIEDIGKICPEMKEVLEDF